MERILLRWYFDIPIVTRCWVSIAVVLAVLDQGGFINYMQLCYRYPKVFTLADHPEIWRLFTTFTYFGKLNESLIFHLLFLSRYSSMVEESLNYLNNPLNYLWILILMATNLIICSTFIYPIMILSQPLNTAVAYLWARRNPNELLAVVGVFQVRAAYLPWVMLLFTATIEHSKYAVIGTLYGIFTGHLIFFFEDVYPRINGGRRSFVPPWEWFELEEQHPRFGQQQQQQQNGPQDRQRHQRGVIHDILGADQQQLGDDLLPPPMAQN